MFEIPFGDAVHGPWCNTRTYRTTCRICHERVFYFSCDHGSKVFLDFPGHPWPIHTHGDNVDAAARLLLGDMLVEPAGPMEVEVTGEIRVFHIDDVAVRFGLDPEAALTAEILRLAQLDRREFIHVAINEHVGESVLIYNFLVEREIWKLLGNVQVGDTRAFMLNAESLPIDGRFYWICVDVL